jgi:hypothetical protein
LVFILVGAGGKAVPVLGDAGEDVVADNAETLGFESGWRTSSALITNSTYRYNSLPFLAAHSYRLDGTLAFLGMLGAATGIVVRSDK